MPRPENKYFFLRHKSGKFFSLSENLKKYLEEILIEKKKRGFSLG
jgi:hypothetical protein